MIAFAPDLSTDWVGIVEDLIGCPFEWGGRGPETFDCWGLVLAVHEHLGVARLPDFSDYQGDADALELIREQIASARWRPVDRPEPGDVLALGTRRRMRHCGVWTPYGVLHCARRSGVTMTDPTRLALAGYRHQQAYRWGG